MGKENPFDEIKDFFDSFKKDIKKKFEENTLKEQLLYKKNTAGVSWKSDYWHNITKQIKDGENGMDSDDPQGIAEFQGNKLDPNYWSFRGDGTMQMGGKYPRLYIDNTTWRNIEFTGYFKRLGTNGKSSDGINFGCRSHINGHREKTNNGKFLAETHTYYGRCRNDGQSDVAKEIHHKRDSIPAYASTYRTWGNGQYRKSKTMFYGGTMPSDVWIGWKLVVMDLNKIKPDEEDKVLIQTWIDLKSEGDSTKMKKENWELVESVIDVYGKIPCAPSDAYKMYGTDPKSTFYGKQGVCLIRNGYGDALYKDIYIQEIKPIKDGCQKTSPKFERRGLLIVDYITNLYAIGEYVITQLFNLFGNSYNINND